MWRWEGVKMRRWDTDPHYWKHPALKRSREKKAEPPFIRISSNSIVYLPTKKSEPQFICISSNSFAYFPLQKKSEPQFIRISSNSFVYLPKKNLNPNSFVYLPIHSYIFPSKKTRRRMAREHRRAKSSVASMETLNYKVIYWRCIIGRREE